MHVVGHEHVSVNGTTPIGNRFLEPMEVTVIILLGKKARLPIDASLYEVLRDIRQFDAWTARHQAISVKYPKPTPLTTGELLRIHFLFSVLEIVVGT